MHFDLQITFSVELIYQLLNDVMMLLNYKHNHFELHEQTDKNVDIQHYVNHYLIDDAILRYDY